MAAVGGLAAHLGASGVSSSSSSFFRPFDRTAPPPPPPPPFGFAGVPPVSSSSAFFQSASAFDPPTPSSFGFASAEELPPDAVLRVLDPGFGSVSDAARSEFHRMLSFIVDLSPQAAGSPSVAPPLRALFEGVRSALSEADSCLFSFIASGRGDFLLLPSHSPLYLFMGILRWVVWLLLTRRFLLCSIAN